MIHRFSCAFCSGTCHFVFWHGFPAGLVWHTGHEWAWLRVSPLTRPPSHKIGCRTRFYGPFALSWCYLNSPLCKPDTCKHMLLPPCWCGPPSHKIGCRTRYHGLFAPFWCYLHSPVAKWAHVNVSSCHSRPRGEENVRCLHDSSAEARPSSPPLTSVGRACSFTCENCSEAAPRRLRADET